MSIPWPYCPLNISAKVFQTTRQIEISSLLRVHIFVSVPEFLPPYFFLSRAFLEWPRCCISTAASYWIIMKSKTPEKFEKLLPNEYWLLVPWRFYAWHTHHTSRPITFFYAWYCNTKNTFYETKVLKTKHVTFLKYIYNAFLLDIRTSVIEKFTGPTRDLLVAVRWTGANFDHCNDKWW